MKIKSNKLLLIQDKDQQANYYIKEQKIIDYGESFFTELIECSSKSKNICDKILPITCYYDLEDTINAVKTGEDEASFGHLWTYGNKQSILKIGINGDSNKLTATLKQNIRHEIIHYFLYLLNIPYDDNSLPFWCICYLYDAGAYDKLKGLQDDLYQFFVTMCQEIDTQITDNSLNSIKVSLAINLHRALTDNNDYNKIIEIVTNEVNKDIDISKKIDSLFNGKNPTRGY